VGQQMVSELHSCSCTAALEPAVVNAMLCSLCIVCLPLEISSQAEVAAGVLQINLHSVSQCACCCS
jgi:hypothetical protein